MDNQYYKFKVISLLIIVIFNSERYLVNKILYRLERRKKFLLLLELYDIHVLFTKFISKVKHK